MVNLHSRKLFLEHSGRQQIRTKPFHTGTPLDQEFLFEHENPCLKHNQIVKKERSDI